MRAHDGQTHQQAIGQENCAFYRHIQQKFALYYRFRHTNKGACGHTADPDFANAMSRTESPQTMYRNALPTGLTRETGLYCDLPGTGREYDGEGTDLVVTGIAANVMRTARLGVLAVALLAGGCETMHQPEETGSTQYNPFARVLSNRNAEKPKQGTSVKDTDSQQAEAAIQEHIYPATGPRMGKAVYDTSRDAKGGFNVNFADASLPEVVQTILGDLLDVPFVLDPRVQGKVNVSTGGPVSREALIQLLEAVLGMNNAAMVKSGDTWRIAPSGEVVSGGQTRFLKSNLPGYGMTLIPLQHVSATNMVTLLENSVTKAGALKADAARNLLFVTGSGVERENAVAAVKAFDVDWLAGQATGIIPLHNASAEDVITELQTVMQTEPGGAGEGAVRFMPIERINAIMVLAGSNELLSQARTWIQRLDIGGPSDMQLRTYKIDNGKAMETADLLNALFSGQSYSPSSSVSPDLPESRNTSRRTSTRTNTRTTSTTSSKDGAPRIIGDSINNTLVVMASPQDHQLIAQALRKIDHPPAQVLIDMVIAEVRLNDALRYGVQYFFTTNGLGNIADSGRGGFSTGSDFDANGIFPGFNFILDDGTDARFALDLLDSITDLKVVSSPHIVALDNQPAHLQVGDEVPVITRQAQDVVNANAPQVNTVEFRDTGVILDVTPRISSTGLVTMEIRQEVSNVSTSATTGELTPTISKREMESTVAARSGQTVILGGLISDTKESTESSLPGVNKVPVLKNLVGSHNVDSKRIELLVFLTPRVLDLDEDMSNVVDEIRSRMTLISREAEKARAENQAAGK